MKKNDNIAKTNITLETRSPQKLQHLKRCYSYLNMLLIFKYPQLITEFPS